nr:TonB-dependent receptor [Sphingomonas sp. dw_22]
MAFATGPDAGTTAHIDDRNLTTSGEVGVEWTHLLAPSLTAKLLALGMRKHIVTRSGSDEGGGASDYRGDSLADERIVRAAFDRPSARGLGWEAGAEFADNALGSRSRLNLDGTAFPLPGADVKVSERRVDLFGRLKGAPAAGLLAEATLRGETSTLRQLDRETGREYARDFGFLKPKLTLQWDAGRHGQLRLRVEREVGQLDFSDFASSASLIEGTIDAGNAALRPQTEWTFEAAWERRFGTDGSVTLTGRHQWIDNVLDRMPVGDLDAPGNIGRGTIGAAAVRISWPLDRLGLAGARVNFDGERRWSSVRDPMTGEQRAISGSSPFSGTLHATLDRPRLKSSWALDVYFSETATYRRIDEIRATRDQPYASLKWIYRPTTRLTVETTVENLLSRKRERERTLHDGRRDTGTILYDEQRVYRSRSGLFLSFRYQ